MNCACGTLETKADVECSKQMSAEENHMQVVAKVAESNQKLLREGALHYTVCSARSRKTGLVTV